MPQTPAIDNSGLLDEDPRLAAIELDRRPNVAGRALAEVGETSVVLNAMNSSAWTTTA